MRGLVDMMRYMIGLGILLSDFLCCLLAFFGDAVWVGRLSSCREMRRS